MLTNATEDHPKNVYLPFILQSATKAWWTCEILSKSNSNLEKTGILLDYEIFKKFNFS
jgi:hypothetical protein